MEQLRNILALSASECVFPAFEKAATDLIRNWKIVTPKGSYHICELELYYYSEKFEHRDPFAKKSKAHLSFGRWQLSDEGASITLGDGEAYGSMQLRSICRDEDMAIFNGPIRVFKELFEDGGDIGEPIGLPVLKRNGTKESNLPIYAVPRVGLNFNEHSKDLDDRLEFAVRPYRFIRSDLPDYADKYVAYLFLQKVSKVGSFIQDDQTIYKKYLESYKLGYEELDMENIWTEHSKLLRIAQILGMKQRKGELMSTEVHCADDQPNSAN